MQLVGKPRRRYFYPRPPRGGRLCCRLAHPRSGRISIHALREEGDGRQPRVCRIRHHFYPRPPRGGRRQKDYRGNNTERFLSTPSARRATLLPICHEGHAVISIHALREEGDAPTRRRPRPRSYFYPRPPRGGRPSTDCPLFSREPISIHALREEGDCQRLPEKCAKNHDFYPRPPRGGRRWRSVCLAVLVQFLSTPSARRATLLL